MKKQLSVLDKILLFNFSWAINLLIALLMTPAAKYFLEGVTGKQISFNVVYSGLAVWTVFAPPFTISVNK